LLFYARVATLTGPFVVMIYKMIAGDVLIFTKVFIMFDFRVAVPNLFVGDRRV
jgi:hypothetical protein